MPSVFQRSSVPLILFLLTCLPLGCAPTEQVTDLAIRRVGVVDIEAGTVRSDQTILISGERIVDILPGDKSGRVTASDTLDGSGLFAIPGLWDMHVHALWDTSVAESFLPAFVRHGITGIRDMGGDLQVLGWARKAGGSKWMPWPTIVAAGKVLDGPEPVDPSISIAVSGPDDGVRAVEDLVSSGADFIKVYTLLPRDAYFAVVEASARLGVPVAGHVPASVSPLEAAEAGQASIEHLRDELGPFCQRGEEASCDSLMERFRALGTYNTPTLAVLEAKSIRGYRRASDPGWEAELPETVRAFWEESRRTQSLRPQTYFDERDSIFTWELELVARLARVGAPLLAGSDAGNPYILPGPGLHRELELMVKGGLTAREALASATLVPARFLGVSDSVGALCSGCIADVVLLRRNPLEDISSVRQIAWVVLRGKALDASRP